MESPKWWQRWFDIPVIQVLVRHASGTIVAVGLFWTVGKVVSLCISDAITLKQIESIESFMLRALLIFLVIQLGAILLREFWKDIKGGWNGTQLLAF